MLRPPPLCGQFSLSPGERLSRQGYRLRRMDSTLLGPTHVVSLCLWVA